jgi:hypothetical protein
MPPAGSWRNKMQRTIATAALLFCATLPVSVTGSAAAQTGVSPAAVAETDSQRCPFWPDLPPR